MLVSFDIFETLSVRSLWPPQSVFTHVGNVVASHLGCPLDAERFAAARWQAEQTCFSKMGASYTLHEIYRSMEFDFAVKLPAHTLCEIESEAEISIANPIAENVQRVRHLQDRGQRVVFVSDTYLPRGCVAGILKKVGVNADDSDLFLSHELGCFKAKGKLFRAIESHHAIQWRGGTHIGNSMRADVRGAKAVSLDAVHFDAGNSNAIENRIDSSASKFNLAAAGLNGSLRVARLSDADQLHADHPVSRPQNLGVSLIAVAILCFLSWVLSECRRLQSQRVYLLARDGYLLHRVSQLDSFKIQFPELEFRYLYGSRRAWLDANAEGRALVAEYLQQEGVFDSPAETVIVDTGWRGSLHSFLCEQAVRRSIEPLQGLYFGLDELDSIPYSQHRNSMLKVADVPGRVEKRIDSNVKFMIESIFQAPHGSTCGYRKTKTGVSPVLAFRSQQVCRDYDAIYESAIECLNHYMLAWPLSLQNDCLHRDLVKVILGFARSPTQEEANSWGSILVECEPGENNARVERLADGQGPVDVELAPAIQWRHLFGALFDHSRLVSHEKEWRAGRVARSSFSVRKLFSVLGR